MRSEWAEEPLEEWRPVVGYEGLYEVSNLGRVRSIERVVAASFSRTRVAPGVMLSPALDRGYPRLSLTKKGSARSWRVHRLVALAFIGPPPTRRHEVCHNDGDKLNNCVENLRWGTRRENQLDRVRHGGHHLANREACSQGHPYPPDVRRSKTGARICAVCMSDYQRAYRQRKRAA